jgi:hypothetical protein
MNENDRPKPVPTPSPQAYYQSMPDGQLTAIYQQSPVNSPEYFAVMAELKRRGYTFQDPVPAPQTPQPEKNQWQVQFDPQPPAWQNQPPGMNQQYGYQQQAPGPIGKPPYDIGGTAMWQVIFSILGVAAFGLLMSKEESAENVLAIIISIILAFVIMSPGFICSGIRQVVNKKSGFHTSSFPAIYAIFAAIWGAIFVVGWIGAIVSYTQAQKVADFMGTDNEVGGVAIAVVAVGSLFVIAYFFIFRMIFKELIKK